MFKTALQYESSRLKKLFDYFSSSKFVKYIFGVYAIRTSIDCLPMVAPKESLPKSTIYLISDQSKFAFRPPVTSYRPLSYANYRASFITSNPFPFKCHNVPRVVLLLKHIQINEKTAKITFWYSNDKKILERFQ